MEIEKVIRILAITIIVAAFAVKVATHLLFPDASNASDLPLAIMLVSCLSIIWQTTQKSRTKDSNK